jgi:ribosomal protein S12 methylthiotransferase
MLFCALDTAASFGLHEGGATFRTTAAAPKIDGNLFIDEGFMGMKPGDIVSVTVDEAGDYDLWGRLA